MPDNDRRLAQTLQLPCHTEHGLDLFGECPAPGVRQLALSGPIANAGSLHYSAMTRHRSQGGFQVSFCAPRPPVSTRVFRPNAADYGRRPRPERFCSPGTCAMPCAGHVPPAHAFGLARAGLVIAGVPGRTWTTLAKQTGFRPGAAADFGKKRPGIRRATLKTNWSESGSFQAICATLLTP